MNKLSFYKCILLILYQAIIMIGVLSPYFLFEIGFPSIFGRFGESLSIAII